MVGGTPAGNDHMAGAGAVRVRGPPIRAVGIPAGNPVAMLPESATVDRALRTREFVCVVDSWPTDSTRAATLVLPTTTRSEEHTSELQSRSDLVCRLLLEKKNTYASHV